jgi:hypothetical protein
MKHSPAAQGSPTLPLGAAGVGQDLEHICEGTAIRGLGDEDTLAAEKDHESHGHADRGDQVTSKKAHVLLYVGNSS